ncbi:MAG: hypothetical protein KDB63_18765 [Nocardioidaceae bacterium]|nr:hypothetical protein [Nocardioidaceae bacterium]
MITLSARVVEWLSEEPMPGLVAVEFSDASGLVHRLIDKSAVLATDLSVETPLPTPTVLACNVRSTHHRQSDKFAVIDLEPWGLGESGTAYEVTRESLAWREPAAHSDLSARARQAVGLVTFRRWRTRTDLASSELDALEDHLWDWMTVGPEAFNDWYESSDMVTRGAGTPLPRPVNNAATSAGVSVREVTAAVDALIEITYGGLFGGIESMWSLSALGVLEHVTKRHGVELAEPGSFANSLWIDDDWGRPSSTDVLGWRVLATVPGE